MTDLLSTDDAMAALGGIGRTTLFALMQNGQIGSVKIGRRTMIPRDDIDAFIAANRVEAAPTPNHATPTQCPTCGRWFKGDAGMKMHAAKSHSGPRRVIS